MFSYDKKNASSGGQQFYQCQQNEDWFGDCNWPLSTVLLVQNECSGSIRNALCRKNLLTLEQMIVASQNETNCVRV
jgi:hypothetical protein